MVAALKVRGKTDNNVLLEKWNQGMLNEIQKQTEGSQGKARAVSFRPTPLNTSPPPPWVIDEDDDRYKQE
jgi:hypothetical protein